MLHPGRLVDKSFFRIMANAFLLRSVWPVLCVTLCRFVYSDCLKAHYTKCNASHVCTFLIIPQQLV